MSHFDCEVVTCGAIARSRAKKIVRERRLNSFSNSLSGIILNIQKDHIDIHGKKAIFLFKQSNQLYTE